MATIEKKFAGGTNGGWYIGIEWYVNSQSSDSNSSNVTATMYIRAQGSGYTISSSVSKNVSLTINGTTYSGTSSIGIGAGSRKNLISRTVNVPHNADGTKTCSFSCSGAFGVTLSGKYYGTVSHSGSGTFPTINLNSAPWWTSDDTRMNDIKAHVIIPENIGEVTITSATAWDNEQGGNLHYDLHRYINDQYSAQIKWGGSGLDGWDNISSWGQGTRFKWEAKVHDGKDLWASGSRWSWEYTKNIFTRASVDTISSINNNSTKLTFTARTARNSGGGNGHVDTVFGYRIESLTSGVNIYGNNTHGTNSHSDVYFDLGIRKNDTPTQPHYLDYNELKNALRGSNFVGTIRLRLVSWNSYGSSGTYDFNVNVDLRTAPDYTTITYSSDNKITHSGTDYYIPAYLPFKCSWTPVTDPIDNKPCTYEVMYQIGTGGYVSLGTTSSTSYTAYLGNTAIRNNKTSEFRIIVRAKASYGSTSDSGGARITLWDYATPTVKVNTVDRKKDSIVLKGTITTNSSIPNINPTSSHWRWNSGGPNTNNNFFTSIGTGATRDFSLTIPAAQGTSGQIHVASSDSVRDLIEQKKSDIPWGNTNVNIKAYMPVMSLTKNGLGINTRPIDGYKLSVDGSTVVSGTITSRSLNLEGYSTDNTSEQYVGQWTKIATLRITRQYGNIATEIGFIGNGNGGAHLQSGRIIARLKQQNPLGQPPQCALFLNNATSVNNDCFKIIITQNSSTETTGELWFKNTISYDQVFFYQISVNHSNSTLTMHEKTGYTATLPQGTQISCISNTITSGDLATSSNYKGKIANISGDGVMEVGKYIDFHDNSTNDYDVRLQCAGSTLTINGNRIYHQGQKPTWDDVQGKPTLFYPEADNWISRSGRYNYYVHHAEKNSGTLVFAPSSAEGDWSPNWTYEFNFNPDGVFDARGIKGREWVEGWTVYARTISNYSGNNLDISTRGNALALNCGSASGVYVDFRPQWSGSKGTEPSFYNTSGNGWGYIGGSGFSWFRVYGTGGSVSDRNKKYDITKADCSEQYENVKNLNLYNYRTISDKVNQETKEIEEKIYRQDLMLGTMVDELPTETVFYDNESGDGKAVDMYSYTSMILGATKHLIEKVEELEKENELKDKKLEDLEKRLDKMEELINGVTNER